MLEPVRTIAPAAMPLDLDAVKAHLRVDSDDDDALIAALIAAAVNHIDGWAGILGRAVMPQTWRIDHRAFPACRELRLPFGPVQSAIIAYSDIDNAEQTVDAGDYSLHSDARGPVLILNDTASWPSIYPRPDAARVTFVAGYADADAVPAAIKQALLLIVGHWFATRETVNIGNIVTEIPFAATALLAPFRRVGV